MKKLLIILTLLLCGSVFFPAVQTSMAVESYQPLAPITGPKGESIPTNNFPAFLQAIYRIGIGACFVLGVIMFTWAGIEYIVSESMGSKADGKARMTAALTGLAIALVSYILLFTINPDLLKFNDLNVLNVTSNPKTK